jgi:hypothetical protein
MGSQPILKGHHLKANNAERVDTGLYEGFQKEGFQKQGVEKQQRQYSPGCHDDLFLSCHRPVFGCHLDTS